MTEGECRAAARQAPSPAYVIDLNALRRNGAILKAVQEATKAHILLALKAFSSWPAFPVLRPYLAGACASGLWEAQLARAEFGGEIHVYSPAYREDDIRELLPIADHLIFNSLAQWESHRPVVLGADWPISPGLRINPLHSEGEVPLYDPCAPQSRLGLPVNQLEGLRELPEGIRGLHWHTLCEQNSDALVRTVEAVEARIPHLLEQCSWLNLGGGHHITRSVYDVSTLITLLNRLREQYDLQLYLEPGEAAALEAGILVAEVIDVIENDGLIAILDISATCHMPDVLEMPYHPKIIGAGEVGEKAYPYRLGGQSCLAGDVIGDYSFDEPLTPGRRLVFTDMAHYTTVKTSFFNGVRHPAICLYEPATDSLDVVREFSWMDFRGRLG